MQSYKDRYASWRGYGGPGEAWEMIPVSPSVKVLGRGYRSVKEMEGDRFQSWKGIPYAQAPIGNTRFRTAVPMEEGQEEETVMGEWDTGCVRPRRRKDRKDGPKEEFDGHEDCLK